MKKLFLVFCLCLSLVGCNQSQREEELDLNYFRNLLNEVYGYDPEMIENPFLTTALEEAYFVHLDGFTLLLSISPSQKRATLDINGTKEDIEANAIPLVDYLCNQQELEMIKGYLNEETHLLTDIVIADRCHISYDRIDNLGMGKTHYLTFEFW